MPTPSPSWNSVRVHGTWVNQDGSLKAGSYKVSIPVRVTNDTDDVIIPAGTFATGTLNTTNGLPSFDLLIPATDDPDNSPPFQVRIEITFPDALGEMYQIDVPVALKDDANGLDLEKVILTSTFTPVETLVKGIPGGVAELDSAGFVLDASGNRVTGGAAGALLAANNLSDVPSKATARGNLGLGTASTQATSAFATPGDLSALSTTYAPLSKASTSVSVQGFNQAAIDTAYAAVVAAGGGTLVFPPGAYTGALNITANVHLDVLGYGATLQAQADNATLLRISQGVGNNAVGCTVAGFQFDGNGHTGVTAAAVEDTDGAYVRDLFAKNCAVGVLFHTVGSGKWVERCTLADSFIGGCGVGVEFRKETAAMPSFNEVALSNVGVSQSTSVGIKQGAGADFTRTTWANVTVWVPDGKIGVQFGGRLDFARLQFGLESLGAGTGSTGVLFDTTYTNYADPYAHTLQASFVGTFANRIVDNSTGGFGAVLRDGSNVITTQYAPALQITKKGDGFPRVKIGSAGIEVGPGDSATVPFLQTFYGPYYKSSVNMLFQADPGFPNAAANGGAASKAIHVYGTADSYAGYVPVYATSDGPALVPSNAQTGTTYTVGPSDAGKAITMTNAAANTVTIPSVANGNSASIGTVIGIEQLGAGTTSIAAGSGVTINSRGNLLNLAGQYAVASLRKIATDTWLLAGDLA